MQKFGFVTGTLTRARKYRSRHELVFVFRNGDVRHRNNVQLGKFGRNRTNVWEYPSSTLSRGRLDELSMHPTVKPVALVSDAILDSSTRGGIVLDCFCGSGTTIIAAEKVGRRAYAMELDPKYVDVAIRRWQDRAGERAVLASNAQTFAEVELQRSRCRDRTGSSESKTHDGGNLPDVG